MYFIFFFFHFSIPLPIFSFRFAQLFSGPTTVVSHIVQSAGSSYRFGNEVSIQAVPTANPGL